MSTDVSTLVGRVVWHDHVSGDPEAARSFYNGLLGWETEVFMPGQFDYHMIKVGDRTHGGFGTAQDGRPPQWLISVCVDDVDATLARAADAGGSAEGEPMDIPEVGRLGTLRDPQGAVLNVFTPQGGMQEPGTVFSWDELWTTDIGDARRFYKDVIGWRANETDMGGAGTYTLFGIGDRDMAGGATIQGEMQMPPSWLTYLETSDLDSTLSRAGEMGASVLMPRMELEGIGAFAVMADPLGAVVGLLEPAR
jgi:uncharacterized protein